MNFARRSFLVFASSPVIALLSTALTSQTAAFRPLLPLPKHSSSTLKLSSSATMTHNFVNGVTKKAVNTDPSLPTMIVFDLDDCLWSPEMYTLHACPSIPEEGDLGVDGLRGCVGLKVPSNGPTVRLFSGARQVLLELATNPKYAGVILAAASSSEEPSFSHTCLEHLEILPGLTLRQMFAYDAIGRTGTLTPNKVTHFTALHKESKVPYDKMVFFDDCNWGDHCAVVERELGVAVTGRTPRGMQYSEFETAMQQYADLQAKQKST